MNPKRDYYYNDPAHPDGPNYRDGKGWLIGILLFLVIALACYGAFTLWLQLFS